jgi:hypothetical protein
MTSMIELAQQYLSEKGYHFSRRGEAESLQSSFSAENGTYSVFIDTNEEQALVGVFVYAPTKVPERNRRAVMEYLTRLNYGLRLGGFELDLNDGEVRYTQNMDIEGATLTNAMLLNMLHFALDVMDQYYPGLMRVIYADADPKEAFETLRSWAPADNQATEARVTH